jgi:hypothetical protein
MRAADGWPGAMTSSQHVYEVRPRKDHRGVDLVSDVLPFGRLWYAEPNAINYVISYAEFYSGSHDAASRACAVSHVMKSSSVRRVLSVTNSMMFASSTSPINGVSSGIKSNGSTK